MKRTLIAVIPFLLAAPSVRADTTWIGEVLVSEVTNCENTAFIGSYYRSIFRPAALPGNDADSHLTFVSDESALSVKVVNGAISGTGGYAGTAVRGFGVGETYTSTRRNIVVIPAAPTAATTELTISGRIKTFYNNPGCIIRFYGVFTRKIP